MTEPKDRIAKIVEEVCNGNRSEFARRINITPAYAAQLYSGARVASDRTILDICREFRVNEQWLRTGEGEMFTQIDEDLAFQDAIAEISISDTKRAARIRRILKAYWGMTDEEKDLFDSLIERICSEE